MRDTGYTYLLKVDNLKTYFPIKRGLLRRTVGYVKAVDGVSFSIPAGKTLLTSKADKCTYAPLLVKLNQTIRLTISILENGHHCRFCN